MTLAHALAALAEAGPEARAKCVETVHTLLANVLQHPSEPKYRRVRMGNARFHAAVLSVSGGRDLMLVAGFAPDGDALVLAEGADLAPARAVLDALAAGSANGATTAPDGATHAATASTPAAHPTPAAPTAASATDAAAAGADDGADSDSEELALALSLSVAGAAPGPSATPAAAAPAAPTPAADPPAAGDASLAEAIRRHFERLTADGVAPTEAAVQALDAARNEAAEAGTLEGAIRRHFARLSAEGLPPNEAAARALEAAREEMAARAAAGGDARAGSKRAREHAPAAAGQAAAAAEAPAAVEFVRFDAENVATAADQVHEINAFFAATGIAFVDPSFPPQPRSLFFSESSASQWKCADCGRRNPVPPDLPPAVEMVGPQGAAARARFRMRCSFCQADASVEQSLSRPTKWLSARADPIRDPITLQYFASVPWAIIRDEPRPDDARQGALGDCWFICALSVLAETPDRVRALFSPTGEPSRARTDFNDAGAYTLRLCRAGEWHTVVVDDHFPANELDMLAYANPARKQLWVALVEKAAAKLHGCYEALEAGTMAEALTMLTGYATERLLTHRYRPVDELLAGAQERRAAAGGGAPDAEALKLQRKAIEADLATREYADVEELFYGLASRRASGFVIAAACVDRKARELGLQVPHAYGILELQEIEVEAQDEPVRLVKLRNPSGFSSWAGDWGPKSKQWTHDVRQALGADREDGAVFWMAFDDFMRFFASVEVCRVRPSLTETRARGWLPSAFGAGEGMRLSAFARTELDLCLYQEGHSERGTGARTLLDLGMLLLRRGGGPPVEEEGQQEGSSRRLTVVAHVARGPVEQAFANVTLEMDDVEAEYVALPLSFTQLASTEPRRYVAAVHSTQPVLLQPTPVDMHELACALADVTAAQGERKRLNAALCLTNWRDDSGTIIVAENISPVHHFQVDLDIAQAVNILCSRGALFSQDVLPPLSRQVLMVISHKPGGNEPNYGVSMAVQPASAAAEAHMPPIGGEQPISRLHMPTALPAARRALLEREMSAQPAAGASNIDIQNLSAALAATFQQQLANNQGGDGPGGGGSGAPPGPGGGGQGGNPA